MESGRTFLCQPPALDSSTFFPASESPRDKSPGSFLPCLYLALWLKHLPHTIPQKPIPIIHFTLHWPSIPVFAASFFHNTLDCPTCSVHAVHAGIWMCPTLCDSIYLGVAYNSACYPLRSLKLGITLATPSLRPGVLASPITYPILIPRSTQSSVQKETCFWSTTCGWDSLCSWSYLDATFSMRS